MALTNEQERELVEAWSEDPFAATACPACGSTVTGGAYPEEVYGEREIAVPETLSCAECGYSVEVRAVYKLVKVERTSFEYGH